MVRLSSESMSPYLALSERHLDPRIASADAIEPMRAIARVLPPVLTTCFESRLGEEAPYVDFLLRLLPDDGSHAAIAGAAGAPFVLPDALRAHPVWRRLADFFGAWHAPGARLGRSLIDGFLEFDLDRPPSDPPVPCFFFTFHRAAEERADVAAEAIAVLLGDAVPAAIYREIRLCFERLPAGASVFSVGVMFSREAEFVRLCVNELPVSQWSQALVDLGWSGSRADLEAAASDLPSLADNAALAIDVGRDGVMPKVGLELSVRGGLRRSKARWEPIFSRLVERGACLPGKRDGALAWIGYDHERADPDAWPEGLRDRSRALAGSALSVFQRRISHIKLVVRPDKPVEAKTYLESMHYWVQHSASRGQYVLDEQQPGSLSE
jgi:hypothetical protein